MASFVVGSTLASAEERFVSVSGEGKVTAVPDMATINTGVLSEAEDANSALEANNAAVKQLMSVLAEAGIADKDIQTSNFNVSPRYEHVERSKRRKAVLIGYAVSNQLLVRVRELDRLGEILDALVKAGSNQLSGIRFGISDTSELMDKARIAAVRDARHRARLYATAGDAELGEVLSIVEQSSYTPAPRARRMSMAAMEAADSVPIAAGEQELAVNVVVRFELQD